MAVIAAGAALVGAGIAIYGDIKSAQDQASLDDNRALVAREQAQEIADREQANESLRDQAAQRQKLQFGASYAASGKAGIGIGSQLQIQTETDTQNLISAREAAFQEKMLQQQAGVDSTLADETRQAGTLNAIGAGLQGVGRAASLGLSGGNNLGYGGPQSAGHYGGG